MSLLDNLRLFPTEIKSRNVSISLYNSIRELPIISPHGHTNPRWFAENKAFPDPAQLFVTPDHYVFRMLHSQGIALEQLGVPRIDGGPTETDGRKIWRLFAEHYYLFRATPSRLWLDHAFQDVFGINERLSSNTADAIYDHIADCLTKPEFLPRALYEKFGIEVLATTESPLDTLEWHRMIQDSDWKSRIITAYRPDNVIDPETDNFAENIEKLGELSGVGATTWAGYLEAHRIRRAYFKEFGATSTDHGHKTAHTENLSQSEAAALFEKALSGTYSQHEAEMFRGHMLTEMARMSLEDGLVMQIHPGSWRNHSQAIYKRFGADKGFDIPLQMDYVRSLKPLLDAVGLEKNLTIILFGLDESTYARELAPLAGVYPALKLGPAWWFHDSVEGIRRYREMMSETAGFYNTVGFNDDTRAFCSIPARHDVARRVDCAFLADLVITGRLKEEEAFELAYDLTYKLAKQAYKL